MNAREAVESLVRAGQKVKAIQLFSHATGRGIRKSKQAVDFYLQHGNWREKDLMRLVQAGNLQPPAQVAESAPQPKPVIQGLEVQRPPRPAPQRPAPPAPQRNQTQPQRQVRQAVPASTTAPGKKVKAPGTPDPAPQPRDPQTALELMLNGGKKMAAMQMFCNLTGSTMFAAVTALNHFKKNGSWRQADLEAIGKNSAAAAKERPALALNVEQKAAVQAVISGLRKQIHPRYVAAAKKGLNAGYLVVVDTELYFVRDNYGSLMLDRQFDFSDIAEAETSTSSEKSQVSLKVGYFNERFGGMTKQDAEAVVQMVGRG